MNRSFTSGSRQAPDPYDQFLEERNFYRKHTARDASCLFRVVSEQIYDTQSHHLEIRKRCIYFMRKNRAYYEKVIDRDLDEYLDDLSKPKVYGTLLELQAVGCMLKSNVILFEPYNLGNKFLHRDSFKRVIRIFHTQERHFDSVFTAEYIKMAAISQAICYEVLYKDVFKLADVKYAVEFMLHSQSFDAKNYSAQYDDNGYCTHIYLSDGRSFAFDLPENTKCILENYQWCHFHYPEFPSFSENLQREMQIRENFEKLFKTADSLLHSKHTSCVRQLLQEGITPFPYKVAKALDPNMYRNIEFDAWNEIRKELKMQNWYIGDANFKVGAKCHVKLRRSQGDLYTCHIQEIQMDKGYCLVFVEQLGEKLLVPYDSLSPLPADQFKPWSLPYKVQRHMCHKYSSFRYTRHVDCRFKFNNGSSHFATSSHHEYCTATEPLEDMKSKCFALGFEKCEPEHLQQHYHQHRENAYIKLQPFTSLETFGTRTLEYCTMPVTVDHGKIGNDGAGDSDHQGEICPSQAPAVNNVAEGGNENNLNLADVNNVQIKSEPDETSCMALANDANALVPANNATQTTFDHDEVVTEGYNNGMQMMQYVPLNYYTLPEDYCAYDNYGQPPSYFQNPNGLYYVCNNPLPQSYALPAGGSCAYYWHPPPPPHPAPPPPLPASQQAPSMPTAPINVYAGNRSTIPVPLLQPPPVLRGQVSSMANFVSPTYMENNEGAAPTAASVTAPSRQLSNFQTSTARGVYSNYEVRKSFRSNGEDLPVDVSQVRYFYNLGVECYLHHISQAENGSNTMGALTIEIDNMRLSDDQTGAERDNNNNTIVVKSEQHAGMTSSSRQAHYQPHRRGMSRGNARGNSRGGSSYRGGPNSHSAYNNNQTHYQNQHANHNTMTSTRPNTYNRNSAYSTVTPTSSRPHAQAHYYQPNYVNQHGPPPVNAVQPPNYTSQQPLTVHGRLLPAQQQQCYAPVVVQQYVTPIAAGNQVPYANRNQPGYTSDANSSADSPTAVFNDSNQNQYPAEYNGNDQNTVAGNVPISSGGGNLYVQMPMGPQPAPYGGMYPTLQPTVVTGGTPSHNGYQVTSMSTMSNPYTPAEAGEAVIYSNVEGSQSQCTPTMPIYYAPSSTVPGGITYGQPMTSSSNNGGGTVVMQQQPVAVPISTTGYQTVQASTTFSVPMTPVTPAVASNTVGHPQTYWCQPPQRQSDPSTVQGASQSLKQSQQLPTPIQIPAPNQLQQPSQPQTTPSQTPPSVPSVEAKPNLKQPPQINKQTPNAPGSAKTEPTVNNQSKERQRRFSATKHNRRERQNN